MNQAPNHWTLTTFHDLIAHGPQSHRDGHWEPSRPLGMFTLISRFQLAWLVFTGRADALEWSGSWRDAAPTQGKP